MLPLTSPPPPSVKCHSSSPHLPTVAKARGETCSMSGLFHCGRIGDKLAGPLTASSEDVCFRFRKTCIWLPPPPLVLSFFTPCLQRSLPLGAILDSSHVQRTSKCAHDSRGQEKKKGEKVYANLIKTWTHLVSEEIFCSLFYLCLSFKCGRNFIWICGAKNTRVFFSVGTDFLSSMHAYTHMHARTHPHKQNILRPSEVK